MKDKEVNHGNTDLADQCLSVAVPIVSGGKVDSDGPKRSRLRHDGVTLPANAVPLDPPPDFSDLPF